ncbi:MAG TPA: MOSC domain-containing protein, partial [Oceanospirillaceae bacterium]|nr:MOSC domain-containing protein [Oceanospirillaceae bacterium]
NSALDAALSEYLELPCRLVYNASLGAGSNVQTAVSFADAQPLLLTTSASLAALNQRLESPIGMDRFRTNLVVNNRIADVEDAWQKIRIGVCELEVAYPCKRCVLTTIDPVT